MAAVNVDDLYKQAQQLSATKDTYALYVQQMQAPYQQATEEMKRLKFEFEAAQKFIRDNPIDPEKTAKLEEQDLTLQKISQNGELALSTVQNRIQYNSSQEAFESIKNITHINQFKDLAKCVRQIQARINKYQLSNEQLQNEKIIQENLKEDIQRELQELRNQSKGIEDSLTQYSQSLFIKRSDFAEKLHQSEDLHKANLLTSRATYLQTRNDFKSLQVSVDKLESQLPSLKEHISQIDPQIPGPQRPSFDSLTRSTESLQTRADQLSKLFKLRLHICEANQHNSTLSKHLETLSKTYSDVYDQISDTKQAVIEKINQIQTLQDLYKDNQKDMEVKKQEEQELQKQLQEVSHQLDEKNSDLLNIHGQIADQKKKQNQDMIIDYQVYVRQIQDYEMVQNMNAQHIDNETKLEANLTQLNTSITEKIQRYMTNMQVLSIRKQIVSQISADASKIAEVIDSALEETKKINDAYDDRINAIQHSIDDEVNKLQWTVNRSEMLLASMKRDTKEETENPPHGEEKLRDYSTNIVFSTENGKLYVDSISKPDLISILFCPDASEALISQAVFAWHNAYFSDLNDMSKCLTDFCNMLRDQLEDYRLKKHQFGLPERPPEGDVAECVMKIFQNWFELFPSDFKVEQTDSTTIDNTSIRELSREIIKLAERIVRSADDANDRSIRIADKVLEFRKKLDEPMFVKTLKPPAFIDIPSLKNLSLITQITNPALTAQIITDHFMYYELTLYNKIERQEYLRCAWSKPHRDQTSPNLTALTQHFNETCVFVAYTIVQPLNMKAKKLLAERAAILTKWIEIMDAAQRSNNYMLLFEIDGALTNPAIIKLKPIWNELKPETQQMYKRLSSMTAPFRKFATYKEALKKSSVQQTLPYLGPWLTEMTFVEDGNPGKKPLPDNSEGINFTKMRSYYLPSLYLMKNWGTEKQFEIYKPLLEQIIKLPHDMETQGATNTSLFKFSNDCLGKK